MEFFTLLVFLIVTSNGVVVYAQSKSCFEDFTPCDKLNGLLSPCNGAFAPPPANATTYIYDIKGKYLYIFFF
jgi:hypothetical protein